MRAAGFADDKEIICRWRHHTGLLLDAMPTRAELLGFENRWQRAAFPHAVEVSLPSGAAIWAVPPAYLLATKLEAHFGRSRGDLLGSRDFADIVALVDGREELVADAAAADQTLRQYVARALRSLHAEERMLDGVRAQLLPDAASQARAEAVVLPRLNELSHLG